MTRAELLRIVIARARSHGFDLRRWYTQRLGLTWINTEAAVTLLDTQRRYYALLFSHEFASAFWKAGEEITFQVEARSFERVMKDGTRRTIHRKAFIRRSARPDAWRYHLREMALADEPLRYLRRFLHIEEADFSDGPGSQPEHTPLLPRSARVSAARAPKPLPAEPPAFLRRPYP